MIDEEEGALKSMVYKTCSTFPIMSKINKDPHNHMMEKIRSSETPIILARRQRSRGSLPRKQI